MARVLGYGGLANTNGARTFTGKEESAGGRRPSRYRFAYQWTDMRSFFAWLGV